MKMFDVQYKNPFVKDAFDIASEVLQMKELVDRIISLKKLTYTIERPIDVALTLRQVVEEFNLGLRKPVPVEYYWHRTNDVVGKTDETNKLFINGNGLQLRSFKHLIEFAAHEFGHFPLGYGHGSNWTQDTRRGRLMCRIYGDYDPKEYSVSYQLESLVYQLAKEKGLVHQ